MKYDANRIDELVKDIIAITPKTEISWENLIYPNVLRILVMKFVMDIDDDLESPEQMINDLKEVYKNLNNIIDTLKT